MSEIEYDTLVMTIRTERHGPETHDALAERLANSVRHATGVIGASVLRAEKLDELRDNAVPKLTTELHQTWHGLGELTDRMERSLPELVETAFGRGVASMLLQLQQQEAFARHDLACGFRVGAEMAYQHRDAVRASRRLRQLAAEYASLLDAVTGLATEDRAEQHLQAIRQLIGKDPHGGSDPSEVSTEGSTTPQVED